MSEDFEKMTVAEQIRAGLNDSLAWTRGQISLKTTTLPSPPPRVGATEVVSLRRRLNMSQAVFAATMNVSPKTVQSWEQGTRQPSYAALRLIQIVDARPGVVQQVTSPTKRVAVAKRRTVTGSGADRANRRWRSDLGGRTREKGTAKLLRRKK